MFLLRLAAIHNKVLLVVWDHPEPLSNNLAPSHINWSPEGLGPKVQQMLHSQQETAFDVHNLHNRDKMDQLISNGSHALDFRGTPVSSINTLL
jgi:hypothetical protein